MALSAEAATASAQRRPSELFGGWEVGLLILLAALYAAGSILNPTFFGGADAFHALLRDTARYGVMAVGMTFVIVNKDLDLSVGSTTAIVAVLFSILFAPTHYDLGIGVAIGATCLLIIAGFGALRRSVGDEAVELWTVPGLTIVGGVLGAVGVLGSRAGRTRR